MITYKLGDASLPYPQAQAQIIIIAHITNNKKGWGKGFVGSLQQNYKGIGSQWKQLNQKLGDVHLLQPQANKNVLIANMCAQDGFKTKFNPHPLNLNHLNQCLHNLSQKLLQIPKSYALQMPKIGSGLGGGNWNEIQTLLNKNITSKGISITILQRQN